MTRLRSRRGTTLLELLVVLVILGISAGVVVFTLGSLDGDPAAETVESRVAAARQQALARRRTVTLRLETAEGPREVTAFPDGRVVGDTALGFDALTGRPRALAR
jgi:prepilin-type N-terminal cleavage/methylation domain-containing protein